jgi:hypothetical protein
MVYVASPEVQNVKYRLEKGVIMSILKVAIAAVAIILAVGVTAATFSAYQPAKIEVNSPDPTFTGTEAKHFSLNLNEDVNIKSNP